MASIPEEDSISADADLLAQSPLHDAFCPECNYSLRGLSGDRCPECGFSLESLRSRVSQIPWVHRHEIGFFRAYWRTVWMVMFRHKHFRNEIVRPVSYPDAQRFRFVTILHAYVTLLLIVPMWYLLQPAGFQATVKDFGITALMVLEPLALLLFLITITALPSYFFHPRHLSIEQQNRTLAMSYYSCAALAWLPLALACFGLGFWLYQHSELGTLLHGFAALIATLILLFTWFEPARLARRLLHRSRNVVYVAAGVPLLSLIAGLLILVMLPFSILYLILLFRSL